MSRRELAGAFYQTRPMHPEPPTQHEPPAGPAAPIVWYAWLHLGSGTRLRQVSPTFQTAAGADQFLERYLDAGGDAPPGWYTLHQVDLPPGGRDGIEPVYRTLHTRRHNVPEAAP